MEKTDFMEVDKNVPVPQRAKEAHEALANMEIGDSVVFTADFTTKTGSKRSHEGESFRLLASRHYGYKMVSRTDQFNDTVRFWRVE